MKKFLKYSALAVAAMVLTTGCSLKSTVTPAVMTYDGSSVDYTTIGNMKHAKVCQVLADGEGDTTIIAAAKAAGISKIKHVDSSLEHEQFVIFKYGYKICTTVYGE